MNSEKITSTEKDSHYNSLLCNLVTKPTIKAVL